MLVTTIGGRKGIRPVKTEWWGAGMVICLQRGVDLHMAQLMPLPLTISCFSKIQIDFTFLVPAHPGSPGKRPLNGCVCVCTIRNISIQIFTEKRQLYKNICVTWLKILLHKSNTFTSRSPGLTLNYSCPDKKKLKNSSSSSSSSIRCQ